MGMTWVTWTSLGMWITWASMDGDVYISRFVCSGPKIRRDHFCEAGDVCATENAECRGGKCLCMEGYGTEKGVDRCGEYRPSTLLRPSP